MKGKIFQHCRRNLVRLEWGCTSLGLDVLEVQTSEWFLLLHPFDSHARVPFLQKPRLRKQNRKVRPISASQFSVWAPQIFVSLPCGLHCATSNKKYMSAHLWHVALKMLYNGRKILSMLQMERSRLGFYVPSAREAWGILQSSGHQSNRLAVQILNRIYNLSVPQSTYK